MVRSILTASLVFCILLAFAQEIPDDDSLMFSADTLLLIQEAGSSYLPYDLGLVPAEVLYNRNWDNINIRYRAEILPAKTDTIVIQLIGPSDNCFVIPFAGKVISAFRTPRRKYHTGTDIKLARGDSIRVAFDGKVRLARTYSGYGLLVLVRHHNGLETVYGHLSKILVQRDQVVEAGQAIGLGGRTGRATTDHLHFESRIFGIPFDSEKYIDFERQLLKSDTLYYINGRVETSLSDFKPAPVAGYPQSSRGPGGEIIHVIQKGDTLSAIARMYNTSVRQLCEDNNISVNKVLQIGERLVVR